MQEQQGRVVHVTARLEAARRLGKARLPGVEHERLLRGRDAMMRRAMASVFVVFALNALLAAQATPRGPVAADPARYAVLYENDESL